jgi:hypothetical protein
MTEVALHAGRAIDEEIFAAVWRRWKYSRQEQTTLHHYVEILKNHKSLRDGNGCSDADLMVVADWLSHMVQPAGSEPATLFTYRQGDNGYKRYSMGRVETNISADEVNHVKDVILCNRVSLHWSPTRAINNHNV